MSVTTACATESPTGPPDGGVVYAATIRGRDGVLRPAWADRTPEARDYFDHEWGRPVRSETGLFELVVLFVFAGGLTWSGVLARRETLRVAFAGFDPDVVAAYDDQDVGRLLADASMIRNERKIRAAIACARATVGLRETGGLVDLVWGPSGDEIVADPPDLTSIPRSDQRSADMAGDLTAAGFRHIGPVAAQSLLLAAGVRPVRRDGRLAGRREQSTGRAGKVPIGLENERST